MRGERKYREGKRGEGCLNWGVWIRQRRRGGKGEGQGRELGLGRPGTSFFSNLSTA